MRVLVVNLLFFVLLCGCKKEHNILIGNWQLYKECDIIELDTTCFNYPLEYRINWIFYEKYCEINDRNTSKTGTWIVQNDNLTVKFPDVSINFKIISISDSKLILKQGICLRYFEKIG